MDSEQQEAEQAPLESLEEITVDEIAALSEEEVEPIGQLDADDKLIVIGLGASAGGLAALRTFFAALPHNTGMTFVVVVHLSPEHESVLAELLQGYTEMPVQQVQTHVKMEPNHVYVIPPGKRLLVTEGHLALAEFDMPRGPRLQIDTFFRSLAEQHGDGAAIILSGTGSDGAVGIQSIKEQGGLILVQSPEEAEYDGMPKSAIATGLVDIVAPVVELAVQLVAAKQTRAALQLPANPSELTSVAQQTLTQILSQLQVRTGHDFRGYKQATLLRRIGRRMQLVQIQTLSGYLNRLRQDGEEVEALFRDLLIHVTEFFRDRASWDYLKEKIIPEIFARKRREDPVRVWTVGCATGEEAYGIAMLLLEHAATLDDPPHMQVFASDLGRLVLDFAREGVYPEAISADVPEERLHRFFVKDNSHYRIRPEVREMVLFAPHNLLQDPPFSKPDLILCRNLLIYLQRPVQSHVFDLFYYALRPEGYLFLGSAEATDGATEHFDTTSKQHRVYRRSSRPLDSLVLPSLPLATRRFSRSTDVEPTSPSSHSEADNHRLMLEQFSFPSLIVDEQNHVLHLSETVGRFLHPPAGTLTSDVIRLVRPELQSELRLALVNAFGQQHDVQTAPIPVQFNGAPHAVVMYIRPDLNRQRAIVFFLESVEPIWGTSAHEPGTTPSVREGQMESQLQRTQQQLQSSREEYETTVEELRAANEELQSTNEEYRSTLEELETSKEELQSINEELQSVNQEMKVRIDETSQANSDLQNLFAATEIATLFLDRELCVKRYTPRAADLFNLMPPDRGRPIGHLRSLLGYPQLEADARRVLQELAPLQHESQADDGHWYLVSLRPYRTLEDKIDGIVVTCVDISANKRIEGSLRDLNENLEEMVAQRTAQVTELVTQLTISEQEERRRISAILHDDLQQRLFSLNFQLTEVLAFQEEGNLKKAQEFLVQAKAELERSVQITRDLSVDLSPPVLYNEGIYETLQWLASRMKDQHGLNVELRGDDALPLLNEDIRVLLFQIVRELLFNVVKHAEVDHAQIVVRNTNDYVQIEIKDQGRGFRVGDVRQGSGASQGLRRVEQRLHLFGGHIEITSVPGKGTNVTLFTPLVNQGGTHDLNPRRGG